VKKWKNQYGTPTYNSWNNMKFRCYNQKATQYAFYGGRGIKVCNEWKVSFDQFVEDMGIRPERTTLDRINPDGNYEPGNCRWATKSEQSRNRRSAKLVTVCGEPMNACDAAAVIGIKRATLYQRLSCMDEGRAISTGKLERPWSHGTISGYASKKCRCDLCVEAYKAGLARQRDRRRILRAEQRDAAKNQEKEAA